MSTVTEAMVSTMAMPAGEEAYLGSFPEVLLRAAEFAKMDADEILAEALSSGRKDKTSTRPTRKERVKLQEKALHLIQLSEVYSDIARVMTESIRDKEWSMPKFLEPFGFKTQRVHLEVKSYFVEAFVLGCRIPGFSSGILNLLEQAWEFGHARQELVMQVHSVLVTRQRKTKSMRMYLVGYDSKNGYVLDVTDRGRSRIDGLYIVNLSDISFSKWRETVVHRVTQMTTWTEVSVGKLVRLDELPDVIQSARKEASSLILFAD